MSASPPLPVVRGRGASWNPPNRFERLSVERERWTDEDDPAPRTELLHDTTRSILSRNDSPDVGFEYGINPYRGCEHGCSYCLHPDTPVLYADMIWRPIGNVRPGHVLVGFDEYPDPGRTRKLRPAVVEHVWASRKRAVRIVTEHADVLTTEEHRWLDGASRWTSARWLEPGRDLKALPVSPTEWETAQYRRGYLSGLTLRNGTFRYQPGQRSDKLGFPAAYWRIAMKEVEPLTRVARYLKDVGIHLPLRRFDAGNGAALLTKIETRSLGELEVLHSLLEGRTDGREYARGFLAGFFDAEGSNGTSLRMAQEDVRVLERVRTFGARLGFRFVLEIHDGRNAASVRLVGSVTERVRFLGVCRPAIRRKMTSLFGYRLRATPSPILALERGRELDVVDIQTSTGTFFAAGLATHNCYARPTHEYLGFSAGLDFETKILVKPEAPRLLREALSSPRWKPQPIMMSGNTDAYQPVERRLRLTRRCLEVLAEFRNPVMITTKSWLVSRDVDLLAELASHGAVSVMLSVTTLRNDLQRLMEPRAASPGRRLGAIRVLADAGVPVGVSVAPVVPGLTDHELPAILEAAAEAGATFATRIVLRLPHGVKELFEGWLAQHLPERKDKVLNRVREMRGGKLYDPRFGTRWRGEGPWADQIEALFHVTRDRLGLGRAPELSSEAFRRPAPPTGPQIELFG